MTVSTAAAKTQANGNGSTSAFPFSFSYTAKSHIVVVVTSAAGVDSTKVLDTHYTLSDPGDTGTVTFLSSPTDYRPQTGEVVTITRVLPLEQSDDFVNGQGFNSAIIEAALDRITRIEQMLAERISRAPKLKATTTTGELTFPEPSASELVGWNSAGTALENKTAVDFGLTVISAFSETLLDDEDAAEMRATLDLEIGTDVQAYDADLAAIAALATTSYGRSLLVLANATALAAEVDSFFLTPTEGNAAYQPLDSDLTAIAALTTTATGRSLLAAASAAAIATIAGVGTGNTPQFSAALLSGGTPTLTMTDTDTGGSAVVSGSSGTGGLNLAADIANAVANSAIRFYVDTDITGTAKAVLTASDFSPATTGGLALGTSSLFWSSLFATTIELGAASDTTISRASAGTIAVEGQNVLTSATGQPLDADLTAIAALITTATGRSLLAAADAAAIATIAGVGTANNPQFATVELGNASDTTLSRAAAGVLAVEGNQVIMSGKHTVWIPATAMIARTTNGAAAGTVETATNKVMIKTLDFDTSTQEFAQFGIHMPKSWNESTVSFQAVWSHAATVTNFGVAWALEAVALSDDDAADAAFGTAQQVTDTGGTTNDIYITSESAAITIAGSPAENDYVVFQVKRVPADAADTLAVDARLHGIKLFLTINAATDA